MHCPGLMGIPPGSTFLTYVVVLDCSSARGVPVRVRAKRRAFPVVSRWGRGTGPQGLALCLFLSVSPGLLNDWLGAVDSGSWCLSHCFTWVGDSVPTIPRSTASSAVRDKMHRSGPGRGGPAGQLEGGWEGCERFSSRTDGIVVWLQGGDTSWRL